MNREGPALEALTFYLAQCPTEFLAAPWFEGKGGKLHVDALVSDVMRSLGGNLLSVEEVRFLVGSDNTNRKRNRYTLMAIVCWLLHYEWFRTNGPFYEQMWSLLEREVPPLSKEVRAKLFVSDEERREELVRRVLGGLSLRPEGETRTQALDRLSAVDSVERVRLLKEAKAKRKRAERVKKEMAKKAAQAAAAKVSRE